MINKVKGRRQRSGTETCPLVLARSLVTPTNVRTMVEPEATSLRNRREIRKGTS